MRALCGEFAEAWKAFQQPRTQAALEESHVGKAFLVLVLSMSFLGASGLICQGV